MPTKLSMLPQGTVDHSGSHENGGADEVNIADLTGEGAALAAHAALATVHQDAPALIATHAALATVHQDAPALIATHAALDDTRTVGKASDESVVSSTALQNDDELLLALSANEVWSFDLFLNYVAHTSGDLKFGFAIPTGAEIRWDYDDLLGNDDTATMSANGSTGVMKGKWVHGIVVNGANAGNLQVQWAQVTSYGTATVVKAGSALICRRGA